MTLLARLLLLLLAAGLVACDRPPPTPALSHIGILMFGDARKGQVDGFIEGMEQQGFQQGRNVRYTVLNANGNRQAMPGLVDSLLNQQVDLLATAGGLETDTAQKMLSGRNKPPVVALYINAIVERGTVKSRREAGWPITGVDNLNAELSGKRIQLLHDLLPGAHNILLLYYPNIAPSRIGMEYAKAMADKLDLHLDARPVTSLAEVTAVMQSLQPGEVDAMLTVPNAPIDNSLRELIVPRLQQLKVPLITHSRKLARQGGLASYASPLEAMGRQAARLAAKVLNGADPRHLPFETPKTYVYAINESVRRQLGVELSLLARSQVNEYIKTN